MKCPERQVGERTERAFTFADVRRGKSCGKRWEIMMCEYQGKASAVEKTRRDVPGIIFCIYSNVDRSRVSINPISNASLVLSPLYTFVHRPLKLT